MSTKQQEVRRQHEALDPICVKVFEEKKSGKLKVEDRPGLMAALDYIRPGDMLAVDDAARLARNTLEGLIVLSGLFERGIAVKILYGVAAGEHTETSLILELAMSLASERAREISRQTLHGLAVANKKGRKGGRPTVVTDNIRRLVLVRRREGESIRQIAEGVGVSRATVHRLIQKEEVV